MTADVVARGMAANAARSSNDVHRRMTSDRVLALGNRAIFIFGGRSEFASVRSECDNFEAIFELPARDAKSVSNVRVVMAGASPATPLAYGFFVSAEAKAAMPGASDPFAGTTVTFQGQGAGTFYGSPSLFVRSFAVSDPVSLNFPERVDGGNLPLVDVRVYWGQGVDGATLGRSADIPNGVPEWSFAPWAVKPEGKVKFRRNAVKGSSQIASASGWQDANTSFVVGFAYDHAGPVLNVMSIGDSIPAGDGAGIAYQTEGFVRVACDQVNAEQAVVYAVPSNMAWSGQSSNWFNQHLERALRAGLVPDVAVYLAGSPNDGEINAARVDIWRSRLHTFLGQCAQSGVRPIVCTMLPCNPSVHAWGASDALRVDWNAEVIADGEAGLYTVIDGAGAVQAAAPVGGQYSFAAGLTTDGIHPNDAGKLVLAGLVKGVLAEMTGAA